MSEDQPFPPLLRSHDAFSPDLVFEPQAAFSFNEAVAYLDKHLPSNDVHEADDVRFDLINMMETMSQDSLQAASCLFESGMHPSSPGQQLSVVNPADIMLNWDRALGNFDISGEYCAAQPQVARSTIVSERSDETSQWLGQVTPPNCTTPEHLVGVPLFNKISPPRPSQEEYPTTCDRLQREQNGAKECHSEVQQAKKDSGGREGIDAAAIKKAQNPGFEHRRLKNNIAARKCRARKKRNADVVQKRYRRCSAENDYLKSQERELRITLTFLKSCTLQHESPRCDCKALHEFNIQQAENFARGF
ncbi:hypothetical protein LTR37_015571 [Vermiconidia calcicola]|uniref:Uncharacterized protein n=1 Tax=Vermiconidia calcicola TaxID=1690605 RepID=A0ACC3MQG9_9PEZI|nr:hypothetical protein LTR37_015571 [Vermiconidia calcicola]